MKQKLSTLIIMGLLTISWGTTNAFPIANGGGPYTVTEGDSFVLDGSGSFSILFPPVTQYDWDLGGAGFLNAPIDPTSPTASATAVEDGNYTGFLTIVDSLGLIDVDDFDITVNNAAPAVDVGPDMTVLLGDLLNLSAIFTDPGIQDTHTSSIDWGDGNSDSGLLTQGSGGGTVSDDHLYSAIGLYTVTVTVEDDDGGAGFDTKTVSVFSGPVSQVPEPTTLALMALGLLGMAYRLRRKLAH